MTHIYASSAPIRIYIGGLILGVNTLYMLFCFFKLFPMVGKAAYVVTVNWTEAMNVSKEVLINHLLIAFQVGPSHIWKSTVPVREGSKYRSPNNLPKRGCCLEYPTDKWRDSHRRSLTRNLVVKSCCKRLFMDLAKLALLFRGRGNKAAMLMHTYYTDSIANPIVKGWKNFPYLPQCNDRPSEEETKEKERWTIWQFSYFPV